MSALADAYTGVSTTASRFEIGLALVGGFAVSARTEPRFTRDIDLVVAAPGDAEAETLIGDLLGQGFELFATAEHDTQQRLATARVRHRNDTVVDLLFASSGIEPEVVAASEPLELIPGLVVPVATIGHLIALKVLSTDERRPQDSIDLSLLLDRSTPADRAQAMLAVELIEERGYNRGRNLKADLTTLID